MASNKISMQDVAAMVRHWLRTPVHGYLGSDYGQDIKALLQQAMSAGLGDEFLQKMIADVPILASLPPGSLNLYLEAVGNDKQRLIIDLAGAQVTVDSLGEIT